MASKNAPEITGTTSIKNLQSLLVTVPEAARLLRISNSSMYDLIAKGEISFIQLGRKHIRRKTLEDFLIEHEQSNREFWEERQREKLCS